ncbi:hypothetical protein, partial [Streptomyces sp. NPDC001759]
RTAGSGAVARAEPVTRYAGTGDRRSREAWPGGSDAHRAGVGRMRTAGGGAGAASRADVAEKVPG